MATLPKGRINLPNNPKEFLELANAIYQKHLADAATSPLNALSDYNWETEGPKIAETLANHNKAEELQKQMEQAYRERDKNLPDIKQIVRNSSQTLKAIYSKNTKKLGEWGFVVDDTPKAKKVLKG